MSSNKSFDREICAMAIRSADQARALPTTLSHAHEVIQDLRGAIHALVYVRAPQILTDEELEWAKRVITQGSDYPMEREG